MHVVCYGLGSERKSFLCLSEDIVKPKELVVLDKNAKRGAPQVQEQSKPKLFVLP